MQHPFQKHRESHCAWCADCITAIVSVPRTFAQHHRIWLSLILLIRVYASFEASCAPELLGGLTLYCAADGAVCAVELARLGVIWERTDLS